MSFQKISPARLSAFRIIKSFESKGASHLKDLIGKEFSQNTDSQSDKGLATEIAYGVTRWRLYLDSKIDSKYKAKKDILIILRMSLYQLIFLSKIPEHAVVDEAVKMVRFCHEEKACGFVNWFLRDFIRKNKKTAKDIKADTAKEISVNFSFPLWLVTRWVKAFGIEKTAAICEAQNRVAGISLKVNTLKITPDGFEFLIKLEGLTFSRSRYFDEVFNIKSAGNKILRLINDGYCYVQDEASAAVGEILSPQREEMILDMCASPGGKSLHIANLTGNGAFLVSMDKNYERTAIIKENAELYGASCVKPVAADALEYSGLFKSKFDRILVDAPCSGTGIIRRHPDIKWRRRESDISMFSDLQLKLLKAGTRAAKPGGIIVYSTCTLEKEECEDIVYKLMEDDKGVSLLNIKETLREPLQKFANKKGFFRTLPTDGMDGFFCAMIKKI